MKSGKKTWPEFHDGFITFYLLAEFFLKQRRCTFQAEEGKTSPEPVVPSIENGKSVAEHQPTSAEMNGRKIPEQAPPSDQSGLLNKEGEAPGHGSDPAVVATPGATEAAAEQPEAQEVCATLQCCHSPVQRHLSSFAVITFCFIAQIFL